MSTCPQSKTTGPSGNVSAIAEYEKFMQQMTKDQLNQIAPQQNEPVEIKRADAVPHFDLLKQAKWQDCSFELVACKNVLSKGGGNVGLPAVRYFLHQFSRQSIKRNLFQYHTTYLSNELKNHMKRKLSKQISLSVNSQDLVETDVQLAINVIQAVQSCIVKPCVVDRITFCVLNTSVKVIKSLMAAFDVCFYGEKYPRNQNKAAAVSNDFSASAKKTTSDPLKETASYGKIPNRKNKQLASELQLLKQKQWHNCQFELISSEYSMNETPERFRKFACRFLSHFSQSTNDNEMQEKCNQKLLSYLNLCLNKKRYENLAFLVNSLDLDRSQDKLAIKIINLILNSMENCKVPPCSVKRVVFFVLSSRHNILKSFLEAFDVCFAGTVVTTLPAIQSSNPSLGGPVEISTKIQSSSNITTEAQNSKVDIGGSSNDVEIAKYSRIDQSPIPAEESGSSSASVEDCPDNSSQIDSSDSLSSNITRTETLLIRNIACLTSLQVLEYYFCNKRRSGGGPIRTLSIDELGDCVSIDFADNSIVDRVLAKTEHILENQQLFVTRQRPVDMKKFYLAHVPDWVIESRLLDFLEARLFMNVQKISFNRKKLVALIEFATDQKLSFIQERLSKKSLVSGNSEIYIPLVNEVRYTDTVIIDGKVPSLDAVTLFIEQHLEGNADGVNETVLHTVPGKKSTTPQVLVIFEDYRAVEIIGNQLNMNGVDYPVTPFYEWVNTDFF